MNAVHCVTLRLPRRGLAPINNADSALQWALRVYHAGFSLFTGALNDFVNFLLEGP